MHQIISALELIRFDLQFVKKAIQFPTDVCYNDLIEMITRCFYAYDRKTYFASV